MKEKFNPGVKATPSGIRRHKRGMCATPRCRHKHAKGGWFCGTCNVRAWRWNHPDRYAFQTLRTNASKRHEFTLTFEQFKEFDTKFDYTLLRGNDYWSIVVDRKDPTQGYHAWNIQGLTHQVNSYKENYGRKFGREVEAMAFADGKKPDECPF